MRSPAASSLSLPAAMAPRPVLAPVLAATPRARVWAIDPSVAVVVGARCLGILVGIVSSVITARFLQPAGRGEYFVALTAAQLIAQFGNLGLHSSNTFFLARDRGLFGGLLANSLWVSFVVMPLVAVALLSFAPASLVGATSFSGRLFVITLAPLMVFSVLGGGLMVGLNQVTSFGFMQPLNATLILLGMVVAGGMHAGPNGFLAASAIGWAGAVAVMLWLLFRQSSGTLGFKPDIFTSTFGYSTKAYFATLAGFIVLRLNVFTLHAVSGAEQVGFYSVASQIADTLGILPQSAALVLFPRLAACKTGQLKMMALDALRTGVLLAAGCAAVWVLADPGIRAAFGPRFAPAVPVLHAMLPGVFLLGVMSIVSQYLAANDFPLPVVVAWLAAGMLTAVLGRPLVVRYGAVGAGATLSVVYAALLATLVVMCWRVSKARALAEGGLSTARPH